jgi:hypothetical protein
LEPPARLLACGETRKSAEIEYEEATTNNSVAQMDKRSIGELQRWLAVNSDPDCFAAEHLPYAKAKAVLAAKQFSVRIP